MNKGKKPGTIPPNAYNEHSWIIGEPEIGEDVWIGAFTLIDGSGGLSIGRGCNISSGAHIYTHSTVRRCLSEGKYNQVDRKPVKIGDYVFVGANSTILMGSKIGHSSIIGAGSVVLENSVIPPYSIFVGVPGKIVKSGKIQIERIINSGEQPKDF
ncbi:MAG: acyltransferase [Candidatus Woykebacteria bacterium]